jgi:hypothetical protein
MLYILNFFLDNCTIGRVVYHNYFSIFMVQKVHGRHLR